MRLFAALSLPGSVVEELARLVARLSAALPGLTLVRPQAMHLTLRFYGELGDAETALLRSRFAAARLATRAGRVVVGGYGQFPPRGDPRVLYVGLREGEGAVTDLWREIQGLAPGIGEPAEPDYRPHVTLARARRRLDGRGGAALEGLREALDALSLEAPLTGVGLYRSVLERSGPRYTILEEIPCAP